MANKQLRDERNLERLEDPDFLSIQLDNPKPLSPCQKLQLAVLEDALMWFFQRNEPVLDKRLISRRQRRRKEVKEWFIENNPHDAYPFTARNICESLDINFEYFRRLFLNKITSHLKMVKKNYYHHRER